MLESSRWFFFLKHKDFVYQHVVECGHTVTGAYYVDGLKKMLIHFPRKWPHKCVEEILTASQQCTTSRCCSRHKIFGWLVPTLSVLARFLFVWLLGISRSQKTITKTSLCDRYRGSGSCRGRLETACKQRSGLCFWGMETEVGKVNCKEGEGITLKRNMSI